MTGIHGLFSQGCNRLNSKFIWFRIHIAGFIVLDRCPVNLLQMLPDTGVLPSDFVFTDKTLVLVPDFQLFSVLGIVLFLCHSMNLAKVMEIPLVIRKSFLANLASQMTSMIPGMLGF